MAQSLAIKFGYKNLSAKFLIFFYLFFCTTLDHYLQQKQTQKLYKISQKAC